MGSSPTSPTIFTLILYCMLHSFHWLVKSPFKSVLCIVISIFILCASIAKADSEVVEPVHTIAQTFLWMAVILVVAKVSSLVERIGQPSVLGELVIGVIMGNLILVGLDVFEPIKQDSIIGFLSELGVVILLFQIGLESNIQKMKQVGLSAFLVACVGVVVPFVLGAYIVGPWIMPGLSSTAYLFLGATLTATSVGITARVFQDLKKLHTKEARIVLGAAVIDDVLGLIILAVVSTIATVGSVGLGMVSWITAKAILFLIGSIVVGKITAPWLGKVFAKINTNEGMKFTLAISFGLIFAFLSQKIGLAPIVGAFAAGLVLDPVHFTLFQETEVGRDMKSVATHAPHEMKEKIIHTIEQYEHKHVEDLIKPVGFLLVPIFFVVTGMNVKLETLFNVPILLISLGITVVAFIGKIVSGIVAGKVNKYIVGFGMIPRGEVGLIFAMMGKSLGVVSDEIFSAIVVMIILSTLLTPPILTFLLKREDRLAHATA